MSIVHTWGVQLPPLNALRTFEVAARHLNFTRAARELGVTQTAISHQIKLLESHVGGPLFVREARGLRLTALGLQWARELSEVFARLHDANQRLQAPALELAPRVAVSVIPSLAARWLVPRLGQFLSAHPGVDLHISASERLVDLRTEPIDVGIRFGTGRYPGLVVEKLADDALVVVCAPALLRRKRLTKLAELSRHCLLHDDEPEGWSRWLAVHRVRGIDSARGSVLTDSSLLVAAAAEGQGVALARRSLVLDELAAGRLVMPFPKLAPLRLARAYYAAASREKLARPPVAAFLGWLRAQASVLALGQNGHARE